MGGGEGKYGSSDDNVIKIRSAAATTAAAGVAVYKATEGAQICPILILFLIFFLEGRGHAAFLILRN